MTERKRGAKRTTNLKDVAREAGVSIAAVSYSLNGGGTLSEDLRAHIRAVALRIGYRPNRNAQAVRTGRTKTIGLVVPDLTNPFFPALAQSFENAARQAGYTVILIDTAGRPEDEIEGIRHLEEQGVAGAVWCQTARDIDNPAPEFAIPVTVIGKPDIRFDNVMSDDKTGGRLAAQYLIERGHSRFGLLGGASVGDGKDDRRMAFIEATKGDCEIVWQRTTPYSIDLSPDIIETLAQREVTAVMCGNDLIAVGVLRAARRLGIAIPAQLSVIGFDDIPWAEIVTPALTTIRQPVSEMAAVALTLLLNRMEEPERPVRHFKVDVSLIRRDSVADVLSNHARNDGG